MDRGAAALVRRMKLSAGREVVYSRGATLRADLTAWVGNTLFARRTDEPGASVVWGDRDYLIPVADLTAALGGQAVRLPQKGDRIAETIDGTECVFELMTPTGEPVWRYADQTRQVFRLHTKRVPK